MSSDLRTKNARRTGDCEGYQDCELPTETYHDVEDGEKVVCPNCGREWEHRDGWFTLTGERQRPEIRTDGGSQAGGSERPCPVCGMGMYQPAAPGVWWCDECEREYWQEGNGWWRCDTSGEPENVKAVTDGGSYRTDSQGRCLTCEGSGVYIDYEADGEMRPVDCPDCSRHTETSQKGGFREANQGRAGR